MSGVDAVRSTASRALAAVAMLVKANAPPSRKESDGAIGAAAAAPPALGQAGAGLKAMAAATPGIALGWNCGRNMGVRLGMPMNGEGEGEGAALVAGTA